ncbi:hypothetical protein NYO98_04245 [Nocardioides sp. STR2]|uniref:Uncharacterized protein n=1 Tax=Nocardioides pini TaxID=2975053 RepID=A0ABT4C942_9ACTN|nr:hypothetical protein [Nocardioides pini]MCY4725480.1 hypothetical protein [Nocardioides pini]
MMRLLRPGVTPPVVVLRTLLLVLPCAALAVALPQVPDGLVVGGVVMSAAAWAWMPDHAIGIVPLALVAAWWAVHGVVDWRLLVVGVLLAAAHVAATLASYGPATLAVDPDLARLWAARGLLALVPLPVTWLAVRVLDPALAPSWLWLLAGATVVGLLLLTARLTRPQTQ